MTSPPKITAEWIVRAQLTICRPDNKTNKSDSNQEQDPNYFTDKQPANERHFDNENPIQVVYKWSSNDVNTGDASSIVETVLSPPNNISNLSSKDSGSFRSTGGVTSSDSGIGTTSTPNGGSNQNDRSQYQSTCNIILTANTNVIPEVNEHAESFHSTYYTLLPNNQQHSVRTNLLKQNIQSVKDAFSQTSDVPNKNLDMKTYLANSSYRSDETLKPLHPHTKENTKRNYDGTSPSSSNFATPPVLSPPSSTKPFNKKPTRTVHIDVYCTGSDIEDSCSSSIYSNSINEPNVAELESNSTPQTVYDSNQMKLHHIRINDGQNLPRRIIATNQHEFLQNPNHGNLRDYCLAQCDSRDEVNESKQMLFEKHVGGISDGRNIKFSKPSQRFDNTKNRFNLQDEQSDDCISSNYPNSLHSTVRDLTCSSISSILAASNIAQPDDLESSWKDTDMDNSTKGSSICPSDSFDYENRVDRWRIRQMDDAWNDKEKRWKIFSSSIMHDSIEEKEKPDDSIRNLVDKINTYANIDANIRESDKKTQQMNEKVVGTESSDIKSRPIFGRGQSMELPVKYLKKRPEIFSNKNDFEPKGVKMKLPPALIPGYTREHLMRAQKFGSVIETIRKPGHHVGPAKNPDCQCEYCRRWFAERNDRFRERASSLDITFIGGLPYHRYAYNY